MPKTALFIGRFQPFHNGHLDALRQILSKSEINHIIIAIGSAENDFLPENPFTAGERFEMIRSVLMKENLPLEKISIVPIRDLNRYSLWTTHLKRLLPKFDYVFSGSRLVKKLFREYEKDIKVIEIEKNIDTSASVVREAIIKNEDWKKNLPHSVTDYVKKIDVQERMKNL